MAVGLESPSIHCALEELKKVEETPVKQNARGTTSSYSPTEHLNSGHRLSLHSVVRELPGSRGSVTSPTLLLSHGTASRIGCRFWCGLTPRGHDLEQCRGKKINVNDLWELSRMLSVVSKFVSFGCCLLKPSNLFPPYFYT